MFLRRLDANGDPAVALHRALSRAVARNDPQRPPVWKNTSPRLLGDVLVRRSKTVSADTTLRGVAKNAHQEITGTYLMYLKSSFQKNTADINLAGARKNIGRNRYGSLSSRDRLA